MGIVDIMVGGRFISSWSSGGSLKTSYSVEDILGAQGLLGFQNSKIGYGNVSSYSLIPSDVVRSRSQGLALMLLWDTKNWDYRPAHLSTPEESFLFRELRRLH